MIPTRSAGGKALRALCVSAVLVASFAHAQGKRPSSDLFIDATSQLGISFRQQASPTSKKYLLETMGSGVALFDYDNDGRLDIFFANGAHITDPMPKGSAPRKDA